MSIIDSTENLELNSITQKYCISSTDFRKNLPKRNDFIDKIPELIDNLKSYKPILFMPHDLLEETSKNPNTGEFVYQPILFGILEDGRICSIVIGGILPFFDVLLTSSEKDIDEISISSILGSLENSDINVAKYEIVYAKKIKYYHENKDKFLRIYFNKLNTRKKAIGILRNKYDLYWDDETCYYRKWAREYRISLANWLVVSNYKTLDKDISGLVLYVDIKNIKLYTPEDLKSNPITQKHSVSSENTQCTPFSMLAKDKLLCLSWDIEVYSTSDQVRTDNYDDELFMLCGSFGWYYDTNFFLNFCLTTIKDIEVSPGCTTIICKDAKDLIILFSEIIKSMNPDFCCAFNDFQYDEPFILNRTVKFGIKDLFLNNISRVKKTEYNSRDVCFITNKEIKIEANTYVQANYFKVPGLIFFDVMIEFRKINPRDTQWSLNYFLKLNNLGGKYDLNYKDMFRIYKIGNAEQKREIQKYCTIDASSCHLLAQKRNLLMGVKIKAGSSYVTVRDCFFYAGGVRVRNKFFGEAFLFGYTSQCMFTNNTSGCKFSGAWVLEPTRGFFHPYKVLKEYLKGKPLSLPVPDVDFMSLYPSISMAYNISPEMIVSLESAKKLLYINMLCRLNDEPIKYNLMEVEFVFNNAPYKFYIMRYGNDTSKMGLLGKILLNLKMNRLEEKSKMSHYNKVAKLASTINNDNVNIIDTADNAVANKIVNHCENKCKFCDETIISELDAEYLANCSDVKQNEIKIEMNSFYGETGCQRSPLFMIEVSNSITFFGRQNLDFVKGIIEEECRIIYGDTDSLFFQHNARHFKEVIEKYARNEIDIIEFTYALIDISIKQTKILQKQINDKLKADNGTEFLLVQYEKVIYPGFYVLKKHYGGYYHMEAPNIKPLLESKDNEITRKGFAVRGFKYDKRNASKFTNTACFETITESLNVYNTNSIYKNVINKIRSLKDIQNFQRKQNTSDSETNMSENKLDYRQFIRFLKLSSKEGSIAYRFIKKLQEENYPFREPINQIGKIEYVYVKKPRIINITGTFANSYVTSNMELYETLDDKVLEEYSDIKKYVQNHALNGEYFELDINEYVRRELVGIISQFILYRKVFAEECDFKVAKNKATKYLENICDEIFGKLDNTDLKKIYNENKNTSELIDKYRQKNLLRIVLSNLDRADLNDAILGIFSKVETEVWNKVVNFPDKQKFKDTSGNIANLCKEMKQNAAYMLKALAKQYYQYQEKIITKIEENKNVKVLQRDVDIKLEENVDYFEVGLNYLEKYQDIYFVYSINHFITEENKKSTHDQLDKAKSTLEKKGVFSFDSFNNFLQNNRK